jgi:hypothetical protein
MPWMTERLAGQWCNFRVATVDCPLQQTIERAGIRGADGVARVRTQRAVWSTLPVRTAAERHSALTLARCAHEQVGEVK